MALLLRPPAATATATTAAAVVTAADSGFRAAAVAGTREGGRRRTAPLTISKKSEGGEGGRGRACGVSWRGGGWGDGVWTELGVGLSSSTSSIGGGAAAAAAFGASCRGRATSNGSGRRGALVVRAVVDSSSQRSSEQRQRATMSASKVQKHVIKEAERPLGEYMSLPASQYSVLDAERIERVDESSFRCYAPRLKFFAFEVQPVLLVRVEERENGCCIRLLSCTLEGSPLVVAQNEKFSASMVNNVSWRDIETSTAEKELISETTIEVTLEMSGAVSFIPKDVIEGTGRQVLGQVLRVMLPRFLAQLGKDYHAWASGDTTRKPLGTGEL